MITFTVMFIIIAAGSVFCCYLNYYLDPLLSENVFFMFLVSFAGDIFAIRIILLFLLSILKICCNCCQGYKRLKLDQKKVETNMGNAIKNMLMKNKEKRLSTKGGNKKQLDKKGSEDYSNYISRLIDDQKNNSKMGQISQIDEEQKEDEENQSHILSNFQTKKDDDNDG
mmetsp:Transcript_7311/g.6504  ORF Transcript_7311/g.6504 Transcript_7311/m.6504 type:complete len:169 (+) Transcript_7311:1173-1679(+)